MMIRASGFGYAANDRRHAEGGKWKKAMAVTGKAMFPEPFFVWINAKKAAKLATFFDIEGSSCGQ
jgi:hypothetical protein